MKNTCNGKIIDVLLTNVPEYYAPSEIIPAVQPDDPMKGCPSDHNTAVIRPLSNYVSETPANTYFTKLIRPLPQSGTVVFGQWIAEQSWSFLNEDKSPSELVDNFEDILNINLNKYLPQKSIKTSSRDKPYVTLEIKKLDRCTEKSSRT